MSTDSNSNNIFGWKNAFRYYSSDLLKSAVLLPLLFALISYPLCFFSNSSIYQIIRSLTDVALNFIPGLIGFLLSGYAIIIGFSSNEVVSLMSKKTPEKKVSLYEIQNAVFAISLLSLLIALILLIFIKIIATFKLNLIENVIIIDTINYFVLFVVIFLLYFTIFAVKDMIINVFNFGQTITYIVKKNKENEIK